MLPVLQILEDCDVPVERVHWRRWSKYVTLQKEMKLTQEAFDALVALGIAFQQKELVGTKIIFYFVWKGVTFTIDNAADTCEVKKVVEYVPVAAHTEERVSYEQVGDCSEVDTGGD